MEMIRILISIIVPIYNKERHLNNCLESISKQDYENMEIILINDGSKDRCHDIIKEWIGKESRIKYYFQTNQGVALTRNKGISLAKGKYVFFVDADDTIERNAISKLVNEATKTNADIVVSNFIEKKENKINKKSSLKERFIDCSEQGLSQVKADMFLINGRPMASACNKLYKLDFLKKTNIKFENNVFAEDRLFNLKCFVNEPVISVINEYTYMYNILDGSRARTLSQSFYNEATALSKSLHDYLLAEKKLKVNTDLLQYTIINDIDKIFTYVYKYSNKKFSDMYLTIRLLKNNKLFYEMVNNYIKNKTKNNIKGGKKYFLYIELMIFPFIYAPKLVFVFFLICYLYFVEILGKYLS